MRRIRIPVVALVGGLWLAAGSTARAHHSFAVFDHTRTLTIKGSVTKFQWTNPHGFLEVDMPPEADGSIKHFTIELTSINMMSRMGWRSNMIKAGDRIKATVAPLLSGQPAGLGLEILLPDGRKLDVPVPGATTFKRTPETE